MDLIHMIQIGEWRRPLVNREMVLRFLILRGKFIDWLSHCWLFTNDSARIVNSNLDDKLTLFLEIATFQVYYSVSEASGDIGYIGYMK
jgi:hypothetical protein